jgi:hypothetical protein
MKRAGRIIYNGAMALSLLLCLATVGVWVRSGWVSDTLAWCDYPAGGAYQHVHLVRISRGGVQSISWHCIGAPAFVNRRSGFYHTCESASEYPVYENTVWWAVVVRARHFAALGFEVVPEVSGPPFWSTSASATLESSTYPLYFPTLLFAWNPAYWFFRFCRHRRARGRLARRCCVACGFDLRGLAGRCPQCGGVAAWENRPITKFE